MSNVALIESTIADFKQQREEAMKNRSTLLHSPISVKNFIVMTGEACPVAIKFDIDPETKTATRPVVTSIMEATRFCSSDAKRIAKVTKNGNGEVGKSVHLVDALVSQVVVLDRLIAQLEGHLVKAKAKIAEAIPA